MKFRCGWFNLYLTAILAATLLGCETTGSDSDKNKPSDLATLRVHLESHPDPITGSSTPIRIGREDPLNLHVTGAMIGEINLVSAELWDGKEGEYAIHLQFDRAGTQTLEMLSMSYRGKRLAIESQFPYHRWIGLVRMNQRISDGSLLFRPDASREESVRIVSGLNKAIVKMKKLKD